MKKQVTINFGEMTDNMAFWIEQLLENEIEDAKVAEENELLWAVGENDDELSWQHRTYSFEQAAYIRHLESAIEQLRKQFPQK